MFTLPAMQLEAQKEELLGPRRRRKVTYNEARLARAADGGGQTPVKEGADEDFAPTGTAANTSNDDSGGSDLEDERAEGVAGKRVRSHLRLQALQKPCNPAPPKPCIHALWSDQTARLCTRSRLCCQTNSL